MSIHNSIYKFYHRLQQNESFFGFIAWLQEHYITTIIGDIVNYPMTLRYRRNPEKYLSDARVFFQSNMDRVNAVCEMLADEKSKKQYMAAIKYRTERRRIRGDEFSLRDQYFPRDIMKIRPNEVFIDGGAYTGDTINKLLKQMGKCNEGGVSRIISFEPSELNMKLLKLKFGNDNRIIFKQAGLSAQTGEVYFNDRGSSSYLTDKEHANSMIKVLAIDDIQECQNTTWIKMDIEGAEWEALHGAEETIRKNRPILTICLYHSNEDMIRIVEWVREIVPEYRLFIRHHTRRDHETVLYTMI